MVSHGSDPGRVAAWAWAEAMVPEAEPGSGFDLDGAVVVVADDDPEILEVLRINLMGEGYDVTTARDGHEALETIARLRPELAILDIMMPGMDGIEVCRRIRMDTQLKYLSVILLTARVLPRDKLAGLGAGADDYITKPFDIDELLARVQVALRRARKLRDLNPLTRLPGNVEIHEEITRHISGGKKFAVMHIDIDNFKAFNDHYGLARGDMAINLVAQLASEALITFCEKESFLGHEGGDDLVAVVDPRCVDPIATALLSAWDSVVLHLYDEADRRRGHIDVPDRQERMHRYLPMTLSIGVATNVHRTIGNAWEATEIAAEMKHFAKRNPLSSYAVDKRRPGFPKA